MSTTRSLLRTCASYLDDFEREFGFYLDSLDRIYHLQGLIGLERQELSALPEPDQNRFKSYLFIVGSASTTSLGALRLFAGNLYSDAFALLRMLYEACTLMHYGNQSSQHGDEVYRTLFKSGLDGEEHSKGEWSLIRKATKQWEAENPDMVPLRQYVNNFGAHVSRAKIVLGNITARGDESTSVLLTDNSRKQEFVMGLELLHALLVMALEEYDRQAAAHPGSSPSVAREIAEHQSRFMAEIRPRLQRRAGLPSN